MAFDASYNGVEITLLGHQMISLRDKVKGMFFGVAVGDALGMPVETWNRAKIKEKFPNGIRKYEKPEGHKWFTGMDAGTITDDTQLTIAVIKGLIDDYNFGLDAQAKSHVEAMKETTSGWGKTTVEAIRRLANGVSWKESGKTSEPQRGTGNGVPMRIAPLAAWYSRFPFLAGDVSEAVHQRIVEFSAMTHYTQMSAQAALVHFRLLVECLLRQPFAWNREIDFDIPVDGTFARDIRNCPGISGNYDISHLNPSEDDLRKQLNKVVVSAIEKWDDNRLEQEFGGGSCYVFDSLPYTYSYFVRDPRSLQTLYDLVEAGGDTDSNASMAGALIGALNGIQIFEAESHLLTGLKCYEELKKLTEDFCDSFGIKDE